MSEQLIETRRFCGYAEAADYLGVSVGFLRKMVERKQIKTYRVGEKLVRFDRRELDQLVRGEAGTGESTDECDAI